MNINNIFQKIIKKKIPSEIVYQNKKITAFKDISPKAPIHILIVPNKFIKNLNYINKKNICILSEMLYTSIKIAKKKKFINQDIELLLIVIKMVVKKSHIFIYI